MRVLLVLASFLLLSVLSVSALSEGEYQSHFTSFVKKYEKRYKHEDFFHRFNVFKANLDLINAHNAKGASYTLAVNEFADLTVDEFMVYNGLLNRNIPQNDFPVNYELSNMRAVDKIDWRERNAVTPVKNQGSCGSCWAFSATGAIEGAVSAKYGRPVVGLSEQQLMDCSASYGNHGCNGGLMTNSFAYVLKNGGICAETEYPYKAVVGPRCQSCQVVAKIASYTNVPAMDEAALRAAASLAPVSIAVAADSSAFQFYSSGVFSDPSCGTRLNHGITLVGYDTTANPPYYIVKNSWGEKWGAKGYMLMAMNKNQCGVSQMNTYVTAA